jgi:sigma-B regulation protein RsbU (phosphoserine phosphatase)
MLWPARATTGSDRGKTGKAGCDPDGMLVWRSLSMQNPATELFRSDLLDRRERLQQAVGLEADERLIGLLSEVDAALERIERGTYGLCETCHDPIERHRLMADPLERYCLDHLTLPEQRALEQDLQLAAEIQRGLLPRPDVRIDGWDVAHRFEPLGVVSGDYCDVVVPEATGEAYFLLGDVSGKGVAASILMSNLHATFRTLLAGRLPVASLIERANRLFCETTIGSQYATLVCVKAAADGEIEVVNAGHYPAMVRTGNRTIALESGGLPLGMFCRSGYQCDKVRLGTGDTVLLYTDGLVEARNGSDLEYGQERLASFFDGLEEGMREPRRLTEALLEHLAAFAEGSPRRDDLTIMAIRRNR